MNAFSLPVDRGDPLQLLDGILAFLVVALDFIHQVLSDLLDQLLAVFGHVA